MLPWQGDLPRSPPPQPRLPRSIPLPGDAGWVPQARDDLVRSMRGRLAERSSLQPHVTPKRSLNLGKGSPHSRDTALGKGSPHSGG